VNRCYAISTERDGFLVVFAILRPVLELVALRVVLEDFIVDFVHRRRFKVQTILIFAGFPKKGGETEA
jgi:hypothetical protein